MPGQRPGDTLRDQFERLSIREAERRGLAFGHLGGFHRLDHPQTTGKNCRGWHSFRNVKENTIFRFSPPLPDDEDPASWEDTPCRHGCTWLYVLARAQPTMWNATTRRFLELDHNLKESNEEAWLVLLDQIPTEGYVISRARLRALFGYKDHGDSVVWIQEEVVEAETRFQSIGQLFDIATERPDSSPPKMITGPPPAPFCSIHRSVYQKFKGMGWICPLCRRDANA